MWHGNERSECDRGRFFPNGTTKQSLSYLLSDQNPRIKKNNNPLQCYECLICDNSNVFNSMWMCLWFWMFLHFINELPVLDVETMSWQQITLLCVDIFVETPYEERTQKKFNAFVTVFWLTAVFVLFFLLFVLFCFFLVIFRYYYYVMILAIKS